MCLFFVILKLENWMNMCCPVVLRRTKYILEKDDRVLKKKKTDKNKVTSQKKPYISLVISRTKCIISCNPTVTNIYLFFNLKIYLFVMNNH